MPLSETGDEEALDFLDTDEIGDEDGEQDEMDGVQMGHGEDGGQSEELDDGQIPDFNSLPVPSHLKDISSLASWTVSTYKPGSGVSALRHPSPLYFWQSDGPQPHILNIHFFKFVSIAHMRIYLDFELDESYTPTKMQFLAGTGHHDLQHVCEMSLEQPKGWLDVDLSSAGGPAAFEEGEIVDWDEEDDIAISQAQSERARLEAIRQAQKRRQLGCGGTLRCFLVQLRILENHQNGKDTHLRGLQIFGRDENAMKRRMRKSVNPTDTELQGKKRTRKSLGEATRIVGLREPAWSRELEIR